MKKLLLIIAIAVVSLSALWPEAVSAASYCGKTSGSEQGGFAGCQGEVILKVDGITRTYGEVIHVTSPTPTLTVNGTTTSNNTSATICEFPNNPPATQNCIAQTCSITNVRVYLNGTFINYQTNPDRLTGSHSATNATYGTTINNQTLQLVQGTNTLMVFSEHAYVGRPQASCHIATGPNDTVATKVVTIIYEPAAVVTPTPTNNPPKGFLDTVSCTAGIAGWAFDPDSSNYSSVHIYKDGTHTHILTADETRSDVGAVFPGRTNSGYSMPFPDAWKDGLVHSIVAYGINVNNSGTPSGNSPPLIGSPKSIVCVAPTVTAPATPPSPLRLTPPRQTVPPNVSAELQATGGTGTYSWYAEGGSPEYGIGADFATAFSNGSLSPISKTVYVTSGLANASGLVTVTEISTFKDDINLAGSFISPSIPPPSPSVTPFFSPPLISPSPSSSPLVVPSNSPDGNPPTDTPPPDTTTPPIAETFAGAGDIIGLLSIASAAAVAMSAIAAVLQIVSSAGAFAFLWQQMLGILGLLPARKKVWGTVYDSNTKRPIPFVKVQLFDRNKRVLETRIADKDGRYGFLTTPETLIAQNIQVSILPQIKDYAFPSHTPPSIDSLIYSHLYYGDLITVTDQSLINYDIPMDPLHPSKAPLVLKSPSIAFGATIAAIADAGFWLGLIMVPLNFILNPSPFTLGILFLFFGTASLRIWGVNEHPFGVVKDLQTGRPMPFALITLNDLTGRRVAFTVTDEKGRYFMVIEKGTYEISLFTPATVIPTRQTKQTIDARKGWITRELKV